MTLTKPQQYSVFTALALMMAFTRYHHFLPIPDASWAIYFVGGFYLKGMSRWAFPALMLEAMAIDYVTTQHFGVSSYCITPAYAFLVPTHAALWLGGYWLQTRLRLDVQGKGLLGLGFLAGSAFVAVSIAFAISNGSFYWLGGRHAEPNMVDWIGNFAKWYPYFLSVPLMYIAIVAAIHVLVARTRGTAAGTQLL